MGDYSLSELSGAADVTPRTIRYYISAGLLPPPSSSGPAARYDDGHLHRLRLIRQLQRGHLPLAEIRARLAALSDADVARVLSEPRGVADSAAEYIRAILGDSTGAGTRRHPGAGVPHARVAPQGSGSAVSALAAPRPPAPGERSQWERVRLSPDIELHIRRPLGRDQNKRVDRLLAAARAILEEEAS